MSNWRVIARACKGVAHRQKNLPCQDYAGYKVLANDTLIGAVADGAGSAQLSEIGAELAVESTLGWLSDELEQDCGQIPLTQESAREVFLALLDRIIANLQSRAQLYQCTTADFACTLLVFIASSEGVAAMQIGDGFIVIRPQGEDYQLMFQPDKGEYANQTIFITSEDATNDMKVRVLRSPPTFICSATDGLEGVAIRLRDWTPHSPFFKPFEEYLAETPDPEQAPEYLEQFLTSERLNERTTDDKTMLLAQCGSVDGHYEQFEMPENASDGGFNGAHCNQW